MLRKKEKGASRKKLFPPDKNSFLKENIRNTLMVHILTLRGKIKNTVHKTTSGLRQDTVSIPHFHRGCIFRSKKRSYHYLQRKFRARNYIFAICIPLCKKGYSRLGKRI